MASYAQKLAKILTKEDEWAVHICLKQIAHSPPHAAELLPYLAALLEDNRLVIPKGIYAGSKIIRRI